jgi:hypothetical protein
MLASGMRQMTSPTQNVPSTMREGIRKVRISFKRAKYGGGGDKNGENYEY